ncbi:hypothetical protein L9F63_005011, partial [Diploptera punctata]
FLFRLLYLVWVIRNLHSSATGKQMGRSCVVQPDCESEDNEDAECAPVSVSWEGSAEMQSGDILLVRIDDTGPCIVHSKTSKP